MSFPHVSRTQVWTQQANDRRASGTVYLHLIHLLLGQEKLLWLKSQGLEGKVSRLAAIAVAKKWAGIGPLGNPTSGNVGINMVPFCLAALKPCPGPGLLHQFFFVCLWSSCPYQQPIQTNMSQCTNIVMVKSNAQSRIY